MRPDSISSLARLVASASNTCGGLEMRASRSSAGIVGLLSTAATFGSANSSAISARRRLHSSSLPSCWASSNTAFAYRLALAVATRNFLNRPLDQLPMLGLIECLADDFLGGGDDQCRHLAPGRLERTLTLGLDVFSSRLGNASCVLFGFLPHVLPQLLTRFVRRVDDLLCRLPRFLELGLRFFQPRFGGGARLLGVVKLLRDCALSRFRDLHHLRIDVPGEHRKHDEEREQLDDHRPIDLDDARCARGREVLHRSPYFAGTFERNTNPKARLMKYIASTRPTIVNSQGIIRPCASGWRATPLMNALPARPAPPAPPQR